MGREFYIFQMDRSMMDSSLKMQFMGMEDSSKKMVRWYQADGTITN